MTDYSNTEQRVAEGDALTPLVFEVDSNPESTYTFYKDTVEVTGPPSPSTVNQPDPTWYTVRQTGQPYTGTATSDMSGQYYVKACNTLGCVTSQTTTFVVNCKCFVLENNSVIVTQLRIKNLFFFCLLIFYLLILTFFVIFNSARIMCVIFLKKNLI